MNEIYLHQRDQKYIFHPCSQMKDYETFKPLILKRAYDCYIETIDGHKIIDAISSWWCKSLGHNHPALKAALIEQAEMFEHVIFANTTHETIIDLSQRLTQLMPHLDKVFYAGDGSSAVEIALKMSLHARHINGDHKRSNFLALKNGYHGETLGALSVSDVGIYRQSYAKQLMLCQFIEPLYVNGQEDPLWHDAENHWRQVEPDLTVIADSITALIFEPIVQGAGGMKVISQDFMTRLCAWASSHDIHIIADEIMTGLGRTGKMLACEHANIQPDMICLSKGLTSGWLPFSTVLMTNNIYNTFYDDYQSGKSFLHSHTYSGHALGARVALATLSIIQTEQIDRKASHLQSLMQKHFKAIENETGFICHIRGIGGMIAADLVNPPNERFGYEIYQRATALGALLRPLGNTIYWLPPLIINDSIVNDLATITMRAIKESYQSAYDRLHSNSIECV